MITAHGKDRWKGYSNGFCQFNDYSFLWKDSTITFRYYENQGIATYLVFSFVNGKFITKGLVHFDFMLNPEMSYTGWEEQAIMTVCDSFYNKIKELQNDNSTTRNDTGKD